MSSSPADLSSYALICSPQLKDTLALSPKIETQFDPTSFPQGPFNSAPFSPRSQSVPPCTPRYDLDKSPSVSIRCVPPKGEGIKGLNEKKSFSGVYGTVVEKWETFIKTLVIDTLRVEEITVIELEGSERSGAQLMPKTSLSATKKSVHFSPYPSSADRLRTTLKTSRLVSNMITSRLDTWPTAIATKSDCAVPLSSS